MAAAHRSLEEAVSHTGAILLYEKIVPVKQTVYEILASLEVVRSQARGARMVKRKRIEGLRLLASPFAVVFRYLKLRLCRSVQPMIHFLLRIPATSCER
jgi:hypothetical protein